jgi:putative zinc finger/helix-turn-helix YgiT family protein
MRSEHAGRRRASRTARRTAPPESCPACGGRMVERRGTLRMNVNGTSIAVPRLEHLGCSKCHEAILDVEQVTRFQQEALAIYRSRNRLLSGEEIRAIRVRHRLTQAQLAKLLGLGPNTLSRWEANRFAQTAAMDLLLRMVRDVPESLRYLRRRSA